MEKKFMNSVQRQGESKCWGTGASKDSMGGVAATQIVLRGCSPGLHSRVLGERAAIDNHVQMERAVPRLTSGRCTKGQKK